jgi:hypothetical protein
LEIGDWRLEIGDWRLEMEIYDFGFTIDDWAEERRKMCSG